ncbi:hypothetical protein [Thermogymnomonas acidicola]|uniref:hypothetical protein n=1 Tax=Thermogymnomonas acidicola TaxID=399579 RepID=UPI001494E8FE|nr:hypothetical protein [Thermogymnomonas acidicola]
MVIGLYPPLKSVTGEPLTLPHATHGFVTDRPPHTDGYTLSTCRCVPLGKFKVPREARWE